MGEASYNGKKVYRATVPTDAELAEANEPDYNEGSVAEQKRNGNVSAWAATGQSYGRPRTSVGIVASPPDDYTTGLSAGEKTGNFLSKTVGGLFNIVRKVPDTGVRFLQGLENTTGLENVVIGGRQNPGRGNSHFFGGASYNSGSVAAGRYDRRSGLLDDEHLERSQGSSRGAQVQSSQFFHADDRGYYAFFGDRPQNIAGKGGIYQKEGAAKAFVNGYNNTLKEAKYQRGLIETQRKELGETSSYPYPEHALLRQDLGAGIFLASMRHANNPANNEDYTRSPETIIAAKKLFASNLDSMDGLRDTTFGNLNIKHKETLDKLMIAYGSIGLDDGKTDELVKIIKSSKNEAELSLKLDNFNSPKRAETFKALDAEQKVAYQDLAQMKFNDPLAQKVQSSLLTSSSVWKGNQGIATDTDAQRFVIYPVGQDFALRMVNEKIVNGQKQSEFVDVIIPTNKLEATFALVAKQNIADKANDISFRDSAEEITRLVASYNTDTSDKFNLKVDETVKTVSAAEKAAADKIIADKAAAEQAEKDTIARAERTQQDAQLAKQKAEVAQGKLKELEPQIIKASADHAQTAKAKTEAESTLETAQKAVASAEANLASVVKNNPTLKQRAIGTAVQTVAHPVDTAWNTARDTFKSMLPWNATRTLATVTGAVLNNPTENIANAEKELASKKAELVKATQGAEVAGANFADTEKTLNQLTGERATYTSQLGAADKAAAEAKLAAEEAQKLADKKQAEAEAEAAKSKKPTTAQIEQAADGIVAALRTNYTVQLGETLNQFNPAQAKQEIINNLNSGMTAEQAIKKLNATLVEKDVKLTPEQKEMIAKAADNLGVNIRGQLVSNDLQSVNPSSGLASTNTGPALYS